MEKDSNESPFDKVKDAVSIVSVMGVLLGIPWVVVFSMLDYFMGFGPFSDAVLELLMGIWFIIGGVLLAFVSNLVILALE